MGVNGRIRLDGFMNILSGLGAPGLDRTVGGAARRFGPTRGFDRYWANRARLWDASDTYLDKGLAAKIVDRPADDCLARGVTIEGDADEVMSAEYDRLSVLQRMQDAVRWARLYGASAIIPIVTDGGSFTQPLNLDIVDQVIELRVIDANQIKPTDIYYADPNFPDKFGKPEFYDITPPGSQTFRIHETRVVPVSSDPLPPSFSGRGSIPWLGRSCLDGVVGDLLRYEQALEWSLRLLERKQQGIYSMEGLGELFAEGNDEVVSKRIDLVDMVRGVLNSVVVDKEDSYTIENLGLDGLQSVLQEFQIAVAAASGIPVVVLFGTSSTGLNATGAGDLESYYGMLGRIQTRILKSPLEQITALLWIQRELKAKVPEDWEICFNPLWIPSKQEEATSHQAEATAVSTEINSIMTLVNGSIIMPEEARTIIAKRYPDMELPEGLPDELANAQTYAEDVTGDGTGNQPQPGDTGKQPTDNTGGGPQNAPAQ